MSIDENGKIRVMGSRILQKNKESTSRIVLNKGGSSSTKTFSICQTFVIKGNEETNKIFTISRKTGPALRVSVESDFFQFLKDYELYNEDFHHKTNRVYYLNDNQFNFASIDMSTKIKGLRHNYVWMNEADEFDYDDFLQFVIRLRNPSNDGKPNQLFMDYNPPEDDDHFINRVEERDDALLIPSSYLDNPFLSIESIKEIERLKEHDPEMWFRYGLGLKALKSEKIYPNWRKIDAFPDYLTEYTYGLDFGYNHPTALVRCGYVDGVGLFWKEEIYKSFLTGRDIIKLMEDQGIDKDKTIYADPSRPDIIKEIDDAGYTIEAAENDVYEGIMKVKGAGILHITDDSPNLQKEAKKYSWKKNPKTQAITDQPIKLWDDGMDGGRYGSFKLINGSSFIRSPKSKLIRRIRN